jgi:hypothetical protein
MAEWSQLECEAIVKDYLQMFMDEVTGRPYSKAEHRRALQKLLNNRSEGSIEYKHQNISAILLELGYPYVQGYKPAFNYQKILKSVVSDQLRKKTGSIEAGFSALSDEIPVEIRDIDWDAVFDTPPDRLPDPVNDQVREFSPFHYNFVEREMRNRRLGELGEGFVLELEQQRLQRAGRDDLAREVEWVSKVRGDGAGFDIRSFDERRDEELFIEVKTTNSGKYQPFLISDNEVAFSETAADRYALYRVFDFRRSAKLFTLPGNINQHVRLRPKVYKACF